MLDRIEASTVAVVDDDDDVRDVLGVLLEAAGHSVKTYKSGQQLLSDPELDEVACLVVDQRMPRMTGLALLSELNKRGYSIPSLLITGANDASIAEKAETLGAMTVMEKPVPTQKLLQFVAFSVG